MDQLWRAVVAGGDSDGEFSTREKEVRRCVPTAGCECCGVQHQVEHCVRGDGEVILLLSFL